MVTGSVLMNVDGNGDKELIDSNHRLQAENRGIEDGDVGARQNMVEDDELKVNGVADNVMKDGDGGTSQSQTVTQLPQQQPQGATVCWERFLNMRSLKVLLVEYDDSTRHVVTALLRNCSYEVIEAANGIQAWKILEDLSNHVDLVLTEVVMPFLSGIGLLCKIMSHKSRKNIPVIMMSSHDSMGVVFKCLSRGAVDFLVKPIRKNELKNLWQHVWRRCQSSSGSGSESGTQTQKSVKSKSVERSDNNTGSNDEDENGGFSLNAGDGSDSGSGTQSSWTKQAVEVDSPQPETQWDQIPECPDSTCAQVVHSNGEICGDKLVPGGTAVDHQEEEEWIDSTAMGKDSEIGVPRTLDLQLEYPVEVPNKVVGSKQANQLEMDAGKLHREMNKGQVDLNNESTSRELKCEAANLTGVITSCTDPQIGGREFEVPNRVSKSADNNALNENKESSSVELSLKRLRGAKDTGKTIRDDRNVLRRSESSAFSRYNTSSNLIKSPTGNIGSNSLHENSLEIIKQEPVRIIRSCSCEDPPNQSSAGGSNNMDMGSTTNNAFSKPEMAKNKSAATSTDKPLNPPSAFQPLMNNTACASQFQPLDKASSAAKVCAQAGGTHPIRQIQHHNHYEQSHPPVPNLQQVPPDHDDLSLKKMAASVPHCGSSNMLQIPVEGNAGNYSVNGSASGSNNGSNGQNGSSPGMNPVVANGESDNGIAGKSGSGDASGSGTGNGVDQNKAARREAALTRLRQKRKERCFRKKVRYQSRKRLAEQRPRVRGQFVRGTVSESTSTTNENTSGDTDG